MEGGHNVPHPPGSRSPKKPRPNRVKALYNLRPLKPKLWVVWDGDIVYQYYEKLSGNKIHKLVILLLLLGGQSVSLNEILHRQTSESLFFVSIKHEA